MIKFNNTAVNGWKYAIHGMRNPMNSWEKSDSGYCKGRGERCETCIYNPGAYNPCYGASELKGKVFVVGPNDMELMIKLRDAGSDHRKYLRMITVYTDITAPLYWWKEFDTYKVGTVANSCSTMHKIHDRELTLEDFSHEHLMEDGVEIIKVLINVFNDAIEAYKNYEKYKDNITKEIKCKKDIWWQIIQLLPSSYNQKRTVMLNYEVIRNMYHSRKNHKLDEWSVGFVKWVKSLPYSKLITG